MADATGRYADGIDDTVDLMATASKDISQEWDPDDMGPVFRQWESRIHAVRAVADDVRAHGKPTTVEYEGLGHRDARRAPNAVLDDIALFAIEDPYRLGVERASGIIRGGIADDAEDIRDGDRERCGRIDRALAMMMDRLIEAKRDLAWGSAA